MDNPSVEESPMANVAPLPQQLTPDTSPPPPQMPPPQMPPPVVTPQVSTATMSPTGYFAGFTDVKLPEYELITPQSLYSITVKTMTVEVEENLKGSLITPRKVPEHLNKALWQSIVSKPENIVTYDDFLKNITIKDRDVLMYALYHISYKDVRNYDVTCLQCRKSNPITFEIGKIFQMEAFNGSPGEIINKRIDIPLPIISNVTAVIKQPVIADEKAMLEDMLFQSDKNLELGTEMLVIDKFVMENNGVRQDITGRDNIFRAYNTLSSQDRKAISREYVENFGKYAMKLEIQTTCPSCGVSDDTPIDLFNQFFRSLHE